MCGILGFVGEGFRKDPECALALLQHRGPDDSGEWSQQTPLGLIWMGHTRLAILDLTQAGHQPMMDRQTGNVIIYNGEIFNYRELRDPLERKGYVFRSHSDTEVILALFAEFGASCVHQLRGMFAIVIWDALNARLWFARDRLGIKPLYYYLGPEGIAFGSECRAVRGLLPSRSWRLSQEGLSSYMMWGSVSEPCTLWDNLLMLPPAVSAFWDGTDLRQETYWDPHRECELEVSQEEAITEVRRLIEESVALRTISDVPLGAFLSGGIDSSAVVGALACYTKRVRTLTVAFPGLDYDESPYASQVARRFKADHQVVTLSKKQVLEFLSQAVREQDQPSIDGPNTWIVSKAAREGGLTVAMSGQGGDELFYGYDHFRRFPAWRSWRWKYIEPVIRRVPWFREDQRGRLRAIVWAGTEQEALPWIRALWSPQQLWYLGLLPSQSDANGMRSGSIENRLSWYELRHYLKNTLLRDTDVMSMVHGLEVRVPLLDHRLVEYVLRLPAALKCGDRRTPKFLLVQAMKDLLPKEIVFRKKTGFTLPFERWLRIELRATVAARLLKLEDTGLFPPGFVMEQLRLLLCGKQHWSRVWQLYVLSHHVT